MLAKGEGIYYIHTCINTYTHIGFDWCWLTEGCTYMYSFITYIHTYISGWPVFLALGEPLVYLYTYIHIRMTTWSRSRAIRWKPLVYTHTYIHTQTHIHTYQDDHLVLRSGYSLGAAIFEEFDNALDPRKSHSYAYYYTCMHVCMHACIYNHACMHACTIFFRGIWQRSGFP